MKFLSGKIKATELFVMNTIDRSPVIPHCAEYAQQSKLVVNPEGFVSTIEKGSNNFCPGSNNPFNLCILQ